MGMEEIKPQAIERYRSLIASIANEAIDKVEGITKEDGVVKYRFGLSALKDTNCHVEINNDRRVSVDIFVNVDFGFSIPEVVCSLQETIQRDVERSTPFTVKAVNVNVANINPINR